MRRIVPLLAATLILVLGSYPARAQVPAGALGIAEQFADSAWISRENGEQVLYFAMASRGATVLVYDGVYPFVAPNGWGVVGKGKCHSGDGFTFCSASGRAHELEPGNFEFDPLLSSAYMKIDRGNAQHEVFWTGEGELFYPGLSLSGGGYVYAGAGAGAARHASIEGTIFGEPLKNRNPFWSDLFEGAQAVGEAFVEDRGYVLHDDGTVTLRFRFPN